MRIDQLNQFVKIVELKSISKAAFELNMAQSTLSSSMKNLEEKLGCNIFRKKGRNIIITPQGEAIYTHSKIILQEMELMKKTTKDLLQKQNILSISNCFAILGKDAITDLYKKHGNKNLKIKIEDCAINNIIENVSNGVSEIGIIRFPKEKKEAVKKVFLLKGLEYQVLATENACIVVGKNNPLYYIEADKISVEHIRDMKFTVNYTEMMDNIWMGFFKKLGITKISIAAANVGNIMDIVRKTDLASIDTRKDHTHLDWYEDVRYIEITPSEECELGYIKLTGTRLSEIGEEYINILQERIDSWNIYKNTI